MLYISVAPGSQPYDKEPLLPVVRKGTVLLSSDYFIGTADLSACPFFIVFNQLLFLRAYVTVPAIPSARTHTAAAPNTLVVSPVCTALELSEPSVP